MIREINFSKFMAGAVLKGERRNVTFLGGEGVGPVGASPVH